jgi:hypothetical protein
MLFTDEKETIESSDFEQRVIQEAIDLGLLDEKGQILNERKANYKTEIKKVKVTKQQKLKRLTQRTAMLMGKSTGDADYKKWQKARADSNKYRMKLEKKFASKAGKAAKAIISGSSAAKKSDLGPVEKRKV